MRNRQFPNLSPTILSYLKRKSEGIVIFNSGMLINTHVSCIEAIFGNHDLLVITLYAFMFTIFKMGFGKLFIKVFFRDIEDVVQCYHEDNIAGCSQLNSFIQVIPSQDQLRKQLINICTQSESKLTVGIYHNTGI